MVLVDSSVWTEHLRRGLPLLSDLLTEGWVLSHPFVIGELACLNLQQRRGIFADLETLSSAKVAGDAEVMQLIEDRRLWGFGIGWVDAHLLASALISESMLWTLDRRLAEVATSLGLESPEAV